MIIPVGTTENHGAHSNTGLDNFMVTQIAEGVRRYTAKKGREVNIAAPPLNYGGHPYHHLGNARNDHAAAGRPWWRRSST